MNDGIIFYIFLAGILTVAALFDLRFRRIPNLLTYPAMAAALVYHSAMFGWAGFLMGAGGIAVGLGVFLTFFLLGGMGAGDVKLMGAVGGLLGPKGALLAAIYTALAGGVYALILLAIHGVLQETVKRYAVMLMTLLATRNFIYLPPARGGKSPRLIYGLPIAAGTLLAVTLGKNLW